MKVIQDIKSKVGINLTSSIYHFTAIINFYQIFGGCLVKQQIIYDEKSLKVLKGKPSNFLLVNGHFGYRKARSIFTIKSEIIQFKGKHSLKTHAINLVKLSLKMFIPRIIDNKGHFDIQNVIIFLSTY